MTRRFVTAVLAVCCCVPMLEPGTSRQVTLPAGRWIDEKGKKYRGGKSYVIDVPLDRIPVFTAIK